MGPDFPLRESGLGIFSGAQPRRRRGVAFRRFYRPLERAGELFSNVLDKEFSALFLLFPGLEPFDTLLHILPLYALALTVVLWPRTALERAETFRPTVWRGVLLALGLAWAILSFTTVVTFIYSNF